MIRSSGINELLKEHSLRPRFTSGYCIVINESLNVWVLMDIY